MIAGSECLITNNYYLTIPLMFLHYPYRLSVKNGRLLEICVSNGAYMFLNFFSVSTPGNHSGCESTMYTSSKIKQSQSMCEWHSMGTTLIMSYLYSRLVILQSI